MNRIGFSLLFLSSFFSFVGINAQETADPDANYVEMDDGVRPDTEEWGKLDSKLYVSWASRDVHYVKTQVPQLKIKTDTVVYAWRGERVGVEAVVFSPIKTGKLSLQTHTSDLDVSPRFLRYVITDSYKTCGTHPSNLTPYLVPDVIDRESSLALDAMSTRPIWLTIEVPREIEAGVHNVTLDVTEEGGDTHTLNLRVVVCDRSLPLVSEQQFHLNFWQQPYSVSRYYGVERWSDEHFRLLRPYMELLARAGQSSISAILFYEPWGDQSHDKFSAMIQTTKKSNGTWAYDYSIFDRWVSFMESCGITGQIDCFSMVPWNMTFRYYDESQGKDVNLKTSTSSNEYKELWTSFLQSFAAHLNEKGWFEKTNIAMDERGLSNMLDAYSVAQEAVPGLTLSLAGNYHSELVDKLADYCLAFGQSFTATELKNRRAKGWYSTFYTCCSEKEPNIFTNSLPAEATYLPLFGVANDFDGYLHWSWLNWPDTPLTDSRFRLFAPGDTYVVYPGPRSSVRWERFIEGVEQAEKVRILRAEYKDNGDSDALKKLNNAVSAFSSGVLTYMEPASHVVNYLESVVNDAPEPPAEEVTDYCSIMLAENKRNIAIQKRWLTSVTTTGATTNLDYSADSPSLTGYVLVNTPIVAARGTIVRLKTVATQNDDDLRYCRVALYADWNNDSIFDVGKNERLTTAGSANTANTALLNRTFSFKIPASAALGLTRLRLCYADAWAEEPQPCGELTKGFAMDFPIEIVDEVEGIGNTTAERVEDFARNGDEITLSRPSRLFVYNAAGALLDQTPEIRTYSFSKYIPGTYLLVLVDKDNHRSYYKIAK